MSVPGALWPVVVGVLVGCAVLAAAGPRGARLHRVGPREGGHARWRRSPDQQPGRGVVDSPSMQVLVTQVAGLLRSGVPPQRAWGLVAAVRVDPHGVPEVDDLVDLVAPRRARRLPGGWGLWGPGARQGRGPVRERGRGGARRARTVEGRQLRVQAEAVAAACRLAAEVGAPLAAVLESIVETLVTAARAEDERAAALAGPQSTARVLFWLPGLGALLGMALGADPLGLLLAGGVAAAAPVLGLVLLVVGRRWTTRLVARARVAGSPP